jgi:hypothetical protein
LTGGSINGSFIECRICGDHILQDFLSRHMKMNHPEVSFWIVHCGAEPGSQNKTLLRNWQSLT